MKTPLEEIFTGDLYIPLSLPAAQHIMYMQMCVPGAAALISFTSRNMWQDLLLPFEWNNLKLLCSLVYVTYQKPLYNCLLVKKKKAKEEVTNNNNNNNIIIIIIINSPI